MTHTVAILDVSAATFREIQSKLAGAGYVHAFREDRNGDLLIDLSGLAIRDQDADGPCPEVGCPLTPSDARATKGWPS